MVAFSQFHCECQSLQNVSPATWYAHSFKWLRGEARSSDELKDAMIKDAQPGPESYRLQFSGSSIPAHVRRQAAKGVTRNRRSHQ